MPILRVARAHARVARAMAAQRAYERWAAMARATPTICPSRFVRFLAFWGSTVPQNGRFPALDADGPACKI